MEESNGLVLFGMEFSEQTAEDVAQKDVFLRNLPAEYAKDSRTAAAAAAAAECNNMDPSGSVLVRRGKGVLGSGKLQHHQPLLRVADMTPVDGRIELRPRKGEGSLGVHYLQAVERPIWGARAFSLQGVPRPGRCPLCLTRFWPKGSLPPFTLGAYCLGS